MKLRKLGSQGPEISAIGYGSWQAGGSGWGANPPEDQTIAAMRAAFDAGCTWVDTAEVYGSGNSEKLVGRALEGYDDVRVFTKLAPGPHGSGFDSAGARRGAEASLERLGRDVIDLYQLHWTDDDIPVETTWEAMAGLVDEGLVRHIGVSNFSQDLIERCEKVRHVDSLQPQLSLLWRDALEILPYCMANGTGVICYGPLAYGLLSGTFTKDTTFDDNDWRGGKIRMGYYQRLFAPGSFQKNLDVVDGLRPIADRLGITLGQLALAWVVHQEGVTGAIAGSRSTKHVGENAAAGSIDLTEKDLEEIADLVNR